MENQTEYLRRGGIPFKRESVRTPDRPPSMECITVTPMVGPPKSTIYGSIEESERAMAEIAANFSPQM